MNDASGPPGDQPEDTGDSSPMRAPEDGWISSLVDCLVPEFQAEGTRVGGDSSMGTDNQGKGASGGANEP
ncbi:hypothetical protein PtA15_2A53 [Puccinia triticina]|uniref:Uncharacterized protein n=1 Tax=Puccinia triticina TaxID=208348 RepID=A0ABY7CBA2_9BASI|nr:uncharacterized protein PtA15_2A53 [Puccinia triticina]WAQ81742.1 hypothetical protein PtA15_2A53 [Puccinia triticina]